jgi:hypothetical protein
VCRSRESRAVHAPRRGTNRVLELKQNKCFVGGRQREANGGWRWHGDNYGKGQVRHGNVKMNSTQTVTATVYRDSAAEVEGMFGELSSNGTSYTRENTMWIVRRPNGQISWLETGSSSAGFAHLLQDHPVSQFATFNISTETGVSPLIFDAVSSKNPVGVYHTAGTVYAMGGNKYLCVVIGSNGFIVTAHPITSASDIAQIVFG